MQMNKEKCSGFVEFPGGNGMGSLVVWILLLPASTWYKNMIFWENMLTLLNTTRLDRKSSG